MTVSATVQLYGDIGLYSDYNRTIDFESVEDQEAWFDSQTVALTLDNVAYDKFQNTFACAIDYSTAVTYTYARVANIDSTGKTFYCFVSAVELVDETRCRFVLTVDVLQTYMFQYELGVCAINRQHLDRWTSSSDYPNYIPMDVPSDIGGDVVVYSNSRVDFQTPHTCIFAMVSSYQYADVENKVLIDQAHCNRVDWYMFPVWPDDPYTVHYGAMSFPMYEVVSDYGSESGYDGNGPVAVPYPTYAQVLNGSFIAMLNLNPDECVGVWILPNVSSEITSVSGYTDFDGNSISVWLYDGSIPEYAYTKASVLEGSSYGYTDVWNNVSGYITLDSNTGELFNVMNEEYSTSVAYIILMANYSYMAYRLSSSADTNPTLSSLTEEFYLGNLSVSHPFKPSEIDYTGDHYTEASLSYEPAMYQSPYTDYVIVHSNGQTVMELPDYFVQNHHLYGEITDDNSTGLVSRGYIPIWVKTYATSQGVRNFYYIKYLNVSTQPYVNNSACIGLATYTPGISGDVTSNEWLSYCLTEKDTDRKLAITRALTSFVSGTARGFKTDPENTPPVGIGPGSLAVGMTQGLMGSIDTVASQFALESKKRNAPDSMLVTGTGAVSILNGEDELQLVILMLNPVDREKEFWKMYYYGYKVSMVEVPDTRSRQCFNYLSISDGYIVGSLSQDIKNQILEAYKGGITIFHYPECHSVDYPLTDGGYPRENIEEALL